MIEIRIWYINSKWNITLLIGQLNYIRLNTFNTSAKTVMIWVLLYLPSNIISHVTWWINRHVMANGPSTSVQTLFTPLVIGHRLLTNLIMNDASVTDIINLLHVLATTAITDHTRTINFRQLQSWFARITY